MGFLRGGLKIPRLRIGFWAQAAVFIPEEDIIMSNDLSAFYPLSPEPVIVDSTILEAKPFIKFAKLARASGGSLASEEVEKLSQYLKDPFTALATERSGYPKLKSILRRMGQAIDEGKLRLKGSRLRKGQEEIDRIINKNKLDSLHHDSVYVFSSIQQLLSSKETQTAKSRSEQLLRRLEELRKKREMLEARLNELEGEHEQSLERVSEQKETLEEMVYGSLAKHVNLKL